VAMLSLLRLTRKARRLKRTPAGIRASPVIW
jgi:hypothetical protein